MKLGATIASATERPMSTGFDTDQAFDYGGDGIANNVYWKGISGCYAMADGSYKVLGQSTCWFNVYGRSDYNWPTASATVAAFQVTNADTINGFWTHAGVNITGKTPTWSSTPLSLTFASASKQTLEPASVGASDNFGSSTRIGSGTYGYWKSLTYTVGNADPKTAYFRTHLSGEGFMTDSIRLVQPTDAGLSPDSSSTFTPGSNPNAFDMSSDGVGNVIWKNGDASGNGACPLSAPNPV